jgi:hypothetical protein
MRKLLRRLLRMHSPSAAMAGNCKCWPCRAVKPHKRITQCGMIGCKGPWL